MNASIILVLLVCVSMATCFRINKRRKRAEEYFIEYVTAKEGVAVRQIVTIMKDEVKLEESGQVAVLDYGKMMMTIKLRTKPKCISVPLDREQVPTLEEINEAVQKQQAMLEMPTEKVTLKVQRAKDQSRPDLSPLAEKLCAGVDVEVFEKRQDEDDTTREKRDVGVGEVILIIIIIIILF